MRTVIREAACEDIPALFDIRLSVVENAMTLRELEAAGVTPVSVDAALQSDSRAWLAEVDGEPVGFCMANLDDGCLFALFIRPGFEGRGLGRELIAKAESLLFKRHETIWLTTGSNPDLRAHAFYQQHDWEAGGFADDGQVRYVKLREGA